MQTCFESGNDKLHIHIKNKTNCIEHDINKMFSKNRLVTRKTK